MKEIFEKKKESFPEKTAEEMEAESGKDGKETEEQKEDGRRKAQPEKNGWQRAARPVRFCAGFAVLFAAGLLVFGIVGESKRNSADREMNGEDEMLSELNLEEEASGTEGELETKSDAGEKRDVGNIRTETDGREEDTAENSEQAENGGTADAVTENERRLVSDGTEEDGNAASAESSSGGTDSGTVLAAVQNKEDTADRPLSAEHVHSWEPQYMTVAHEAETRQVWVVDQAAWEEPVYEEQPVYETYGVNICNLCGAELFTSEEISRHGEQYVDWETMSSPFSYHYEKRQRQTGTKTVQTGTVHHEEKGHYETQVIKPAWEEQVQSGFRCSVCGASG